MFCARLIGYDQINNNKSNRPWQSFRARSSFSHGILEEAIKDLYQWPSFPSRSIRNVLLFFVLFIFKSGTTWATTLHRGMFIHGDFQDEKINLVSRARSSPLFSETYCCSCCTIIARTRLTVSRGTTSIGKQARAKHISTILDWSNQLCRYRTHQSSCLSVALRFPVLVLRLSTRMERRLVRRNYHLETENGIDWVISIVFDGMSEWERQARNHTRDVSPSDYLSCDLYKQRSRMREREGRRKSVCLRVWRKCWREEREKEWIRAMRKFKTIIRHHHSTSRLPVIHRRGSISARK